MPTTPTSPQAGVKRAFPTDNTQTDSQNYETGPASPPRNAAAVTSAFRNVSACNRCRVRKNRCDQNLPACAACQKAGVRCVGYDLITKREIPRSYVYFLETRLTYLESLLRTNNIAFNTAEIFDADSRLLADKVSSPTTGPVETSGDTTPVASSAADTRTGRERQEDEKLDNLVSDIGMVSVHGSSDKRYLGSTSGISFARVVLAAVKSSVSNNNSERSGPRSSKSSIKAAAGGSSMRDSYFGLQTKPQIREAPFPDIELAEKLVTLYFEHANPQIPVLHREEFHQLLEHAYSVEPQNRTARELYFLNIVFAIGAGIIWGSSDPDPGHNETSAKRARLASQQAQPEEYHASAIVHLSSFLSAVGNEAAERSGGDLEELQAVLLLAGFALLRPVAPGLWYICGVAMRLAVDLGLHYEEGSGLAEQDQHSMRDSKRPFAKSNGLGRKQYIRDLRRRLWWCTYTFDRLVSTCVGRPFGITDQVITTEFPSLLDDKYISKDGFSPDADIEQPSYKRVAHHYFRLRLLQSEILQVLQYEQAQQARRNGRNWDNHFMHKTLPSPFLIKHKSFRSWRRDIDQRLYEWKESAPHKSETGVSFSIQFLELNYWQAVIVLYRQSLSVPGPLAGELSPTEEVTSPLSAFSEDKDDDDVVFLKCAEAGQRTLKLYRQLHRLRLVNYSYLATHHIFMAGISFLYAVWHSPAVRSKLTLDDFDFTVLAAISVLDDLMEKCPPAEACRDAFERMSKATVQMCMSTPGFAFETPEESKRRPSHSFKPTTTIPNIISTDLNRGHPTPLARAVPTKRPPPRFDMDFRDLFPEDLEASGRPSHSSSSNAARQSRRRGTSASQTSHPGINTTNPASLLDTHMITNTGRGSTMRDQYFRSMTAAQPDYDMTDAMPGVNTYNPDFMSNIPGMEFVGRLGAETINHDNMMSTAGSLPESQVLASSVGSGMENGWYESNTTPGDGDNESDWGLGSGFGVGVGMGLDFNPQHDWSDGNGGYDLFDGFFFGGGEGGGGI